MPSDITYEIKEDKSLTPAENGITQEELNNTLTPYITETELNESLSPYYNEEKLKAYMDSYMSTYLSNQKEENFGTINWNGPGQGLDIEDSLNKEYININRDCQFIMGHDCTIKKECGFLVYYYWGTGLGQIVVDNNTNYKIRMFEIKFTGTSNAPSFRYVNTYDANIVNHRIDMEDIGVYVYLWHALWPYL